MESIQYKHCVFCPFFSEKDSCLISALDEFEQQQDYQGQRL